MKKNFTKCMSTLATAALAIGGLLASGAPALADSEEEACSTHTLRGDYGYAAEGVLVNNPGLPLKTPFRSVGLTHFNGNGNLTWVEHTVINGVSVNVDWTAASGTYTVNANCTGTAVVNTPNSPVPLNLSFVVVKQGKEVHSILDSSAISTVFIKVD